jgi:N-carbamoyl-L-amino-acid hydrolase
LDPARIRAFIELHIEQGPVLEARGAPVGVVTAIRGNVRHRFARIRGQTTHAGGVPRSLRQDAVLAGAELASALEAEWIRREDAGEDLVVTLGQFCTDPVQHGITKVPGALDFTVDFRSGDPAVLEGFHGFLRRAANDIAARRGVEIDLGPHTQAPVAEMDPALRSGLLAAAQVEGIEAVQMPSGGGHDCAVFAGLGAPSAMIFVRNANGSHNPDEAMDFLDFAKAWRVLRTWTERFLADLS